jgi:hypothetical protein
VGSPLDLDQATLRNWVEDRLVGSRRMMGWRVSGSMRTQLVIDAFRQALHTRHRGGSVWTSHGLVHHSDAGSQFTSVAFTAELLEAGIAGSIGTVGDALDNALCESTIGLSKTEAIDDGGPTWTDRSAVEWQVARWVHWYNTRRLHSSIGYLPPVECEQQHRQGNDPRPGGRQPASPPINPGRFTPRSCAFQPWLCVTGPLRRAGARWCRRV